MFHLKTAYNKTLLYILTNLIRCLYLANHYYRPVSGAKFVYPNAGVHHSPYQHYMGLSNRTVKDCIETSILNGARLVYHEEKTNNCYSGPGVMEWMTSDDPRNRQFHYLWEKRNKNFGIFCNLDCEATSKRRGKTYPKAKLFQITYKSIYSKLKIDISMNGKKKFIKTYEFAKHKEYDYSGVWPQNDFMEKKILFNRDPKYPSTYNGLEALPLIDVEDNAKRIAEGAVCASYASLYGSQPFGTSRFITFVFRCRLYNTYKRPTFKLKVSGIKRISKVKSEFDFSFEVRNRGEPYIDLPKEIGICAGEYRIINPVVKINDRTYNALSVLTYKWRRVIAATYKTKETFEDIPTEIDKVCCKRYRGEL